MRVAAILPRLREDLSMLPGPSAHDGSPTWTLHDPQSNRFFRLSWPAFEILGRWHLGSAEDVAETVRGETVLAVEAEDVVGVAEFLARGGLLKADSPQGVERLLALHDGARTSWLTWLLHHYLFFRIPLLRPDTWLDRALPFVAWMGTRKFHLATLTALLVGLFLVIRQWEGFTATLVDHFSLTGLMAFGLALGLAKIAHELGHAFTAKAYRCRVPTMGVAFMVLLPMLYTDVNEVWKLTGRRQRLMVGGAGILAELAIAAWATLAWGLLPDGTARGLAFTLATTTWISSLAINLSPFMRFDGYFLAIDALNQPNLHPRSFALARWHLREALFGLCEPEPEHLPPATRSWMIAFAWVVWIYRLFLFLGIAVLVYHFFIKVVGIILFAVEIGWFVLRPFAMEFSEWARRWEVIGSGRRVRRPLALLLGLMLLVTVPWSGRVTAPAILKAETHALVYAPTPAILREVMVAEGDAVAVGAILARLDSPDLVLRREQVEHHIAVLRYELSAAGFEESFRIRTQSIGAELGAALAEKAAITAELDRLTLFAQVAGTVSDLSPLIQLGQWINPREPILTLRAGSQVEAYVAEDDLNRIGIGASAKFIPEGGGASRPATIADIDRVAVRSLTEPSLAVPYGGAIPARFSDKSLVPDVAVYRVRLTVEGDGGAVVFPLRGQAHMEGDHRSLLGRVLRMGVAVLIREWGV